ncbi:MAG: hypothetical protein KGS44_11155 [Alphaproteobacteria bacterium]|nr:hypothetical protein [Alphaproteobacteria bacterium]
MQLKACALGKSCGVGPELLQQPLHDRPLLLVECRGIDYAQPAKNGEHRNVRLSRKPGFYFGQMWIKLRGQAHPRLVLSLGLAMRRPDLGFHSARRFRKDTGRSLWRRGKRDSVSTPANPIAELRLTASDFGKQRDRIKAAICLAQPALSMIDLRSVGGIMAACGG